MRGSGKVLGACIAVAMLALACDDEEPTPGRAQLRVVHAAPGTPAVDVYRVGQTGVMVRELTYGEASDYVELAPGTYQIELRPAGAPDTDPVIFSSSVLVEADRSYTVVAAGSLGATDPAAQFRLIPLRDDFAEVGENEARLRIVHAGVDAPTVAIDLGNDNAAAPEIGALERFTATAGEGIVVPAGQPLQVGIVSGGQVVTAFTTPGLPAGGEIFVIATGLLAELPRVETGFALLVVEDDETSAVALVRQNPRIYVLHASASAPELDVFIGETEIAHMLAFGALSGAVQIVPGTYTLDLFTQQAGWARPAGAPLASLQTPDLQAGEQYLATMAGFTTMPPDQGGLELITFREEFAIDPNAARVRVVHAVSNAPAVDVSPVVSSLMLPTPLVSSLPFSEASEAAGLVLGPGTVDLGIAPAGEINPLATFPVQLTAGMRAFAVLAGATQPAAGEEPPTLLLVETQSSPWSVSVVKQPSAP